MPTCSRSWKRGTRTDSVKQALEATYNYSTKKTEYTLVTNKARGQPKGEVITLQGPQGEYTRICPKNTTEAATWRNLEVEHIEELESNKEALDAMFARYTVHGHACR